MTYQESFAELAQKARIQKKTYSTSSRNEYRYTLYPSTIRKINRLSKQIKIKKSHILKIAIQKLSQEYADNKHKCLKKIYNRHALLLIQNSNIPNDKKQNILHCLKQGGIQ